MSEINFQHGQVVWLGDLAPEWAYELENMRDMVSGKPFLAFNGYGRILSQFDDIVEVQAMVGEPNGCWDGRVFRLDVKQLVDIQSTPTSTPAGKDE